jgi:predicted nucleic acid-binding protein
LIVVDTSAALAALFGQAPARDALVGQRLLAPHVIDAEIAHALRGLVLGGKVTAW